MVDARTAYYKTYILDLKDIAKCSVVYHLFDNLCYKIANIIDAARDRGA